MLATDSATMSLLDTDQGVCPSGHPCRLTDPVGRRCCAEREYLGFVLICWDITDRAIDAVQNAGADPLVINWARSFLPDRV